MKEKLIKNCLLLTITFYNLTAVFSQNIKWQNTVGGNRDEHPFSVELTKNGNYIFGGFSQSNVSGDKTENSRGLSDCWIVEIDDSSGEIIWQKTIGGNNRDTASSTKQTKDGGYIIGGYSNSNISGEKSENSRGNDDYWVIRLDSNRNILWDRTYGGNGVDRLWSIIETDDGGFLMGGQSDSNISGDKTENSRGNNNDVWIIKIDSTGNIEWQKTYGGNGSETLSSIIKSNDGGYILAASSTSNISGEKSENSRGLGDMWIIKINKLGNIIWDKTIGGDNGDGAGSIISTSDGNYLIGGGSSSNISGEKTENSVCISTDIWLVKIDENGDVIWDKTIGGNSTDSLANIRETKDEGIIIGAASFSDISAYKTESPVGGTGDNDYWIVKLNKNGNFEWDKTIGGSNTDQLRTIIQANDGSYVIGGWSTSNISGDKTENTNGSWDYWLLKFEMNSSNNNTQINFSEINICVGEQLNLNAASGLSYKWTGPNGFSSSEQNPIISNVSDVNSGLYHLTFSDSSLCTQIKTINVIVSSPPEIDSLEDIDTCDFNNDGYATFDLSKINTEILSSNNDLVVEFLNGSNNLIDSSELSSYKNTIPNEEIITVKVSHKNNPNCFNFTSFKLTTIICVNPDPDPVPEENIIYFPSFFTPNNDSKNDNWPNNINNKLNIKSITIYDRFGKKIKTLTQFDVGWDGNQQGKTMPTNDYWFKAITLKGEIITGHFSLLRK